MVDNRAEREIYLPLFYAAVKQANAASVVCAYSMVNGNFSCNNSYLETSVLHDEWGDTDSEAADRPSLNLPSAQDELIEAVVAANPNTVVVINAGGPVAMPWLSHSKRTRACRQSC